MAKGSQLSQLKSSLQKAGVTGPPQSKKRKRNAVHEKDREKQKSKLVEIERKMNRFDERVTRTKHDVGGRKVKGVVGKPTRSQARGIEARNSTLLKEYEDRNRSGGILDRRFGENDVTMSLEEKMLERFTREQKQKASSSKHDLFNLDEDEELTHYGQSLGNLDDFDNVGLGFGGSEDEESGQIDKDVVRRTHFGGFDDDESEDEDDETDQPPRKKSKAEVMSEVIAKSKEHKLKRQIERQAEDNVRHQLDQEFDSLRSLLLNAPGGPVPSVDELNPTSSKPASDPKLLAASKKPTVPKALIEEKAEESVSYDVLLRQLASDARSRPKDRIKTEEELAREEKERLEEAEKKRRMRMLGLSEEGEDVTEDNDRRERGGDDLEDDFFGSGIGGMDGSEEEEEDDDDDDEDVSENDSESDGEDSEDDAEGDEGPESVQNAAKELPYTFPMPTTHPALIRLLSKNNISESDLPTVVTRIKALYHPSLGEGNKDKLQEFHGVLLAHILHLTSTSTAPEEWITQLLPKLLPHLADLTKSYPLGSAQHFLAHLSSAFTSFTSNAPGNTQYLRLPDLATLVLLQIIPKLFPGSDLHHPVITPAKLLIGSYLNLSLPGLRGLEDVAKGLFLCTLVLEYEGGDHGGRKYVPEMLPFIGNVLLRMAGTKKDKDGERSFPVHRPSKGQVDSLKIDFASPSVKEHMPRKPRLIALLSERPEQSAKQDERMKEALDLLMLAVELLDKLAEVWAEIEGFVEVFGELAFCLDEIPASSLSSVSQTKLNTTKKHLANRLKLKKKSRQPLSLQAHKPIPLPSYVPKFSSSSSNHIRALQGEDNEAQRLRREVKSERKGALRELRKDNRFIAGVREREDAEKREGYAGRMKRVVAGMEGERGEEKKEQREKQRMKEKKRAGRK